MYSFDTKAFLAEHWPDLDKLLYFLRSYGANLQRQALFKWKLRDSIPTEWFALLLALMELEKGRPISLIPFLRQS